MLHEREAATIKEMENIRWRSHLTVCQKLREIYALANIKNSSIARKYYIKKGEDIDELIKMKAREGTAMAKAMQNKIIEYKQFRRKVRRKQL